MESIIEYIIIYYLGWKYLDHVYLSYAELIVFFFLF